MGNPDHVPLYLVDLTTRALSLAGNPCEVEAPAAMSSIAASLARNRQFCSDYTESLAQGLDPVSLTLPPDADMRMSYQFASMRLPPPPPPPALQIPTIPESCTSVGTEGSPDSAASFVLQLRHVHAPWSALLNPIF